MVSQEELEKMSPEEIAKLQKENCIFCKIVKGEIPSQKVFENDHVVAILDINPATKGHVLVLPKEHYPILPVIPPETFKELFASAKILSRAIKQAVLVPAVSIFVANGAVAGQQSPHFLFHIVPRDNLSDAKNFSLPENASLLSEQESILPSLKQNIPIMMQNHFKREGKQPPSSQGENASPKPSMPPEQVAEAKREHISKMIEENNDVRELIKNNPEEFKKVVTQNPQLVELFKGVDIEALSKNLKSLDENLESDQNYVSSPEPLQTPNNPPQELPSQESLQPVAPQSVTPSPPAQASIDDAISQPPTETTLPPSTTFTPPPSSHPVPVVFLGLDPLDQKNKVFAYFEEKQKAKALLMKDPGYFKELLEDNPKVKALFKDVDINKLSEKLNESEAAQKENEGDESDK